jgi:hypothetical protein
MFQEFSSDDWPRRFSGDKLFPGYQQVDIEQNYEGFAATTKRETLSFLPSEIVSSEILINTRLL